MQGRKVIRVKEEPSKEYYGKEIRALEYLAEGLRKGKLEPGCFATCFESIVVKGCSK